MIDYINNPSYIISKPVIPLNGTSNICIFIEEEKNPPPSPQNNNDSKCNWVAVKTELAYSCISRYNLILHLAISVNYKAMP